jgi:hypothetical protein
MGEMTSWLAEPATRGHGMPRLRPPGRPLRRIWQWIARLIRRRPGAEVQGMDEARSSA